MLFRKLAILLYRYIFMNGFCIKIVVKILYFAVSCSSAASNTVSSFIKNTWRHLTKPATNWINQSFLASATNSYHNQMNWSYSAQAMSSQNSHNRPGYIYQGAPTQYSSDPPGGSPFHPAHHNQNLMPHSEYAHQQQFIRDQQEMLQYYNNLHLQKQKEEKVTQEAKLEFENFYQSSVSSCFFPQNNMSFGLNGDAVEYLMNLTHGHRICQNVLPYFYNQSGNYVQLEQQQNTSSQMADYNVSSHTMHFGEEAERDLQDASQRQLRSSEPKWGNSLQEFEGVYGVVESSGVDVVRWQGGCIQKADLVSKSTLNPYAKEWTGSIHASQLNPEAEEWCPKITSSTETYKLSSKDDKAEFSSLSTKKIDETLVVIDGYDSSFINCDIAESFRCGECNNCVERKNSEEQSADGPVEIPEEISCKYASSICDIYNTYNETLCLPLKNSVTSSDSLNSKVKANISTNLSRNIPTIPDESSVIDKTMEILSSSVDDAVSNDEPTVTSEKIVIGNIYMTKPSYSLSRENSKGEDELPFSRCKSKCDTNEDFDDFSLAKSSASTTCPIIPLVSILKKRLLPPENLQTSERLDSGTSVAVGICITPVHIGKETPPACEVPCEDDQFIVFLDSADEKAEDSDEGDDDFFCDSSISSDSSSESDSDTETSDSDDGEIGSDEWEDDDSDDDSYEIYFQQRSGSPSESQKICDVIFSCDTLITDIDRANFRWKAEIDKDVLGHSEPVVSFDDTVQHCCFPDFEKKDRKGEWEMHARDRVRFSDRVNNLKSVLDPILEVEHRQSIYNSRFQDL